MNVSSQSKLEQNQLSLNLKHAEERAVLHLFKDALEAKTPDQLVRFIRFCQSFRRMSVWNARMAFIQRPGASVIASEYEWQSKGRSVAPDAIPIIILWPFGPIRFVYELDDTLPKIDRAAIGDPFAVKGTLAPRTVARLRHRLDEQKTFRIEVVDRRLGLNRAGSAAIHGNGANTRPIVDVAKTRIGQMAQDRAVTAGCVEPSISYWRIQINERMTEAEQFVTLAHELGHVFCGHLGGCDSGRGQYDESGWPNRRDIDQAQAELEAEAVAYLVASRAGLVTGSAQYLQVYAKAESIAAVEIELIIRAAARIERLSAVHHGMMEFTRRSRKKLGGTVTTTGMARAGSG